MKLRNIYETVGNPNYQMIEGVKGKKAQYLRSLNQVVETCNEYYGSFSLLNVVKLFAQENFIVADSVTFEFDIEQIDHFKEYDRDPSSGWTGKMKAHEYNELKSDIATNGIQQKLYLVAERLDNGNVKCYLGEGNHRLRIAKELGIDKLPISISYRK